VKDAQSRPITAGGFVVGAPVVFTDITHAAGLDRFHHKSGTPEKNTILETPGSGVALLDYDQDGWLDIYLVNGSTFPALAGKESAPKAMLLHNNHDGTFTDVTDKAGVANERWGFGAVVGDFDNDGWRICTCRTLERIDFIATPTTAPSAMWPRRLEWLSGDGRQARPGAITTMTVCWTCLFPAM
jgi:hypothetical protein